MPSVKRYLDSVLSKFDHFATWLPDERLSLGDVGEIKGRRFYLKTTLARLRIGFAVRAGGGGGDWDHSSGSDVSVDLGAKASLAAPGAPSGGATVKLGSAGAFVFQALGCRTSIIENMAEVDEAIVSAYRARDFRPDWIIVDRLVTADSATILISSSTSAKVELTANAPLGSLRALADASLGVKAERWEGEVTRLVAQSQLTPMFGASRLQRRLWGDPQVETVRTYRPKSSATADRGLEPVPAAEWLAEDPL